MVTDFYAGNSQAYGFDDSRTLVARYYRHRVRSSARYDVPIAVANSGSLHANKHFTCLRRLKLKSSLTSNGW